MGEEWKTMNSEKWDQRFLSLAQLISTWSKDPSTQVGAVIVRRDRTIVSTGYNGFPQGVRDDHRYNDRELKYEIILHAEQNALLFAREPLAGCTLYTYPMPPCSRCASSIIQVGIVRVVSPPPESRWRASCALGSQLFGEAAVVQEFLTMDEDTR